MEARSDAHTMLAMVAEREEGPDAALFHLHEACKLAVKSQKVIAHNNLAEVYHKLGDEAKQEEQITLARTLQESLAAEEAEAARKKTEEETRDRVSENTESLEDGAEQRGTANAAEPILAD